jgi:hypothetical protein
MSVIALVFAAWSWASEYSQGTLRQLLIRQPDRVRLFGGKSLAILACLVAATLLAEAVSYVAALSLASANGLSLSAWLAGPGVVVLLASAGNAVVSCVGFAVFGGCAAILLRSPAAAVGVALCYLLPIETLVAQGLKDAGGWLPGQALHVITLGSAASVSYPRALGTAVVCVSAAAVVTTRVFCVRDVA